MERHDSSPEERVVLLEKCKELYVGGDKQQAPILSEFEGISPPQGFLLKETFSESMATRFRCCFCISMYTTKVGLNQHLRTKHAENFSKKERRAFLREATFLTRMNLPGDEQRLIAAASTYQFELQCPSIDGTQLNDAQLEEWSAIFQKQWAQNRTFHKRGVCEAYLPIGPIPWHVVVSLFGPPEEHCFQASAKYQKWAWFWPEPTSCERLLRVVGGKEALRMEKVCSETGKIQRIVQVERVAAFYSFRWNRFIMLLRSESTHPNGSLLSAPACLATPSFFSMKEHAEEIERAASCKLTREERNRLFDEAWAEGARIMKARIAEQVRASTQ